MIAVHQVTDVLLRNWDMVGNGDPRASGFSYLLFTKGREPVGKLVLLAFPTEQRTPRFAIKLPRSKAHNGAIRAEYQSLRTIAPYGTAGVVRTPRPLLCLEERGALLLVESVVDGVELSQAHQGRSAVFVPPVVDWLIHLARTTAGLDATENRADDLPELLHRAAGYASSTSEISSLRQVSDRLRALDEAPLPRIFEQRDMGNWNLMVSPDGRIGILDWESSRAYGYPGWDLFYFLAHYGFMVDQAWSPRARLESFRETFFGRDGFGDSARSAVRRYVLAMSLREEWLAPLFLGCWLHHAVSEVCRLGTRLSDSLFWHLLEVTLDGDRRLNFVA